MAISRGLPEVNTEDTLEDISYLQETMYLLPTSLNSCEYPIFSGTCLQVFSDGTLRSCYVWVTWLVKYAIAHMANGNNTDLP